MCAHAPAARACCMGPLLSSLLQHEDGAGGVPCAWGVLGHAVACERSKHAEERAVGMEVTEYLERSRAVRMEHDALKVELSALQDLAIAAAASTSCGSDCSCSATGSSQSSSGGASSGNGSGGGSSSRVCNTSGSGGGASMGVAPCSTANDSQGQGLHADSSAAPASMPGASNTDSAPATGSTEGGHEAGVQQPVPMQPSAATTSMPTTEADGSSIHASNPQGTHTPTPAMAEHSEPGPDMSSNPIGTTDSPNPEPASPGPNSGAAAASEDQKDTYIQGMASGAYGVAGGAPCARSMALGRRWLAMMWQYETMAPQGYELLSRSQQVDQALTAEVDAAHAMYMHVMQWRGGPQLSG